MMNKLIYKILNSIIETRKYRFCLFLLLIILLTLIMMILYRPVCVITDPYFHHNRLLVLMDALRDGSFPFYLDYNALNGYGYFTKAFYSDLFLIPYALIGNISSLNFAYDFYLFSTSVLCAISMYWAVKRIYKNTFSAIISSILYTFSAYRIFSLFYHTAVAEVITFIFIPIVFVGLYEIIKGNYKKWYILTLGYSAIICTHTITSVLLFITMFVFILAYYKSFFAEHKRIVYLIISGLTCLVLSAYYLYPMLEQMFSNSFYYQTKPFIDIKFTRLSLSDIFSGLTNNLPNITHRNYIPKIGGLLVVIICLRIFIHDKSAAIKSIDLGVAIGLFYIVANAYFFPWTIFPFDKLAFIQFPWRLFKYSTFFFSIAGGFYLFKLLKTNTRKLFSVLFLSVFLILTFRFDANDYRAMVCFNNEIITNDLITNNAYVGGGEYLPSIMPTKDYPFERGKFIVKKDDNSLSDSFIKIKDRLCFDADQGIYELPLTYYKGYKATFNNNNIELNQSYNGLLEARTSSSGYLCVWYEGTFIQKISPYISLISLFLLLVYVFYINRKNNA